MTATIAPTPDATTKTATPAPMGISVEMITAAYAKAETPATPEQLESVLWLFRYARDNKVGGNAALGKLLDPPRDASTISKLFSANYGASLVTICADIDRMRDLLAQRTEVNGVPRVRLPWMTEEVHNFAELVHATRSIGIIWGLNQSGKSTAIDAHVAESRRRTIRVNMPDGAIKTEFLDRCLETVGISPNGANGEKKKAFKRHLNPDTELIVDEFHQCWAHGVLRSQLVEMVRRFRDEDGCSLLLVCTDLDAFTNRQFKGVLSQISNRGVLRLQIPTEPRKEDVAAILEGWRLRLRPDDVEASALIAKVCKESGIGKLSEYLKIARHLANNKNEVFAPSHFMAAHTYVEACAAGNAGKNGKGGN